MLYIKSLFIKFMHSSFLLSPIRVKVINAYSLPLYFKYGKLFLSTKFKYALD